MKKKVNQSQKKLYILYTSSPSNNKNYDEFVDIPDMPPLKVMKKK